MKSIGRNCVALLLALVSVAVAKASTVDTLAVVSKAMNKKVDVTVVVPDNVEKGQKLPWSICCMAMTVTILTI